MPPLTSGFEWDENAIQTLRSMWDEGLSTAEIGRRLGVTKNAIVGKAHRLALPCRPSPIRSSTFSKPRKPKRLRCPTLTELERPATGSPPSAHVVRFGGGSTPGPASARALRAAAYPASPDRDPRSAPVLLALRRAGHGLIPLLRRAEPGGQAVLPEALRGRLSAAEGPQGGLPATL